MNNPLRTIRPALALAIAMALAAPARAITVEIRRQAMVAEAAVTVGDVARVVNGDAAQTARIEAIPLTVLGEHARRTTIDAETIRRRIAEHGINMATVVFRGFVKVEVVWDGHSAAEPQRLATEPMPTQSGGPLWKHVRKAMIEHVAEWAGVDEDDVVIDLPLDAGLPDLDIAQPIAIKGPQAFRWGTAHVFEMTGTLRGGAMRTFSVRCGVSFMEQRVVALTSLRRGEAITADNTRVARQQVGQGYAGDYLTPGGIEGMTAARPISQGQTIRRSDAEPPTLVRRGEVVEARIEGRGFALVRRLTAREDGADGDTIRLTDPAERGRLYVGRVVGPRQVLIAGD